MDESISQEIHGICQLLWHRKGDCETLRDATAPDCALHIPRRVTVLLTDSPLSKPAHSPSRRQFYRLAAAMIAIPHLLGRSKSDLNSMALRNFATQFEVLCEQEERRGNESGYGDDMETVHEGQ